MRDYDLVTGGFSTNVDGYKFTSFPNTPANSYFNQNGYMAVVTSLNGRETYLMRVASASRGGSSGVLVGNDIVFKSIWRVNP